jgi:hypothetical protein
MFYIIVILAAIFAMPASAQGPKPISPIGPLIMPVIKDQLVGAWTLTGCAGGAVLPYCANSNGITIPDASGHYTVTMSAQDRPKYDVKEPYRLNLSGEQTKSLVNGFVANFGTWSFNEADKKITYHIEGALFPNFEGATFDVTVVSLSGDELTLKGPLGQDVWRRLKK